uniref:Uncharacterized protein n=1 Tax=Timema cristinae TaxID=61476 RepID=A0A7R9CFH6_TIMCR|nr:unnamed protein product [Timema cristinae]
MLASSFDYHRTTFHFALVGHLMKGYRHPTPTTVSRTARVLTMLLGIVAKPHKRDKFEVTPENIAYLAALVSVSEEVRSRCHVKHSLTRITPESSSTENLQVDLHLGLLPQPVSGGSSTLSTCRITTETISSAHGSQPPPHSNTVPANRRQKSWDLLDQAAIAQARQQKHAQPQQVQAGESSSNKGWRSLDLGPPALPPPARPSFRTQRSSSVPAPRSGGGEPTGATASSIPGKSARVLFKTQRSFSVPTAKETKSSDELEPKEYFDIDFMLKI